MKLRESPGIDFFASGVYALMAAGLSTLLERCAKTDFDGVVAVVLLFVLKR